MDIAGLQTPRLRRLAEIVAAQALAMQEKPEYADGAEDGEGQEVEGDLPGAEAEEAAMMGEPPAYDNMLDEEDYGEEALEDEAATDAAAQRAANHGLAITGLDPGGKGPNHDPLFAQPPPTPFPHQKHHQHPHPSSHPQQPQPQQPGDGYDETF
jgi:hypothetical protein